MKNRPEGSERNRRSLIWMGKSARIFLFTPFNPLDGEGVKEKISAISFNKISTTHTVLPPGPVHHSFGGPLEPAAGTSSSLSGGLLSGPVHPSSGGPLGPAAVKSSSLFWRASGACCQDQFIPLLGGLWACCQVQFIPLLVGLWSLLP